MADNPYLKGIQDAYWNANPAAAFQAFFQPQLNGPNQNFDKWLRGLEPEYLQEYAGMVGNDPNLKFMDFIRGKNPAADFLKFAPSARGENWGMQSPRIKYGYNIGF